MNNDPTYEDRSMTRSSGIALIIGAVAGLVTMALHPTGHALIEAAGRSPWPARINILAHGLAIASAPVLLFGALGATRRVGASWQSQLALTTFAFAQLAVVTAAIASGLVAPHLVSAFDLQDPAQHAQFDLLFRYNGAVNQAFAAVYVVLSSAAIVLWSIAILTRGSLARWFGALGLVVGLLVLLGFLGGHVRLNIHSFGLIVILQSAWLISVGVALARSQPPTTTANHGTHASHGF